MPLTTRTVHAPGTALLTAALLAGGVLAGGVLAAPAQAAPRRVLVASTSWTSAQQGWVLGSLGCGAGRCTTVARTTDGGTTWRRTAAPAVPIAPSGGQGVDTLRFADDRNGWAFAPRLQATHDGGAHWRAVPVPGGGTQIASLATTADAAYALVSSCVVGDPSDCAGPLRLWKSPVGSDAWTRQPVTLPADSSGVVTAAGGTVYVVGQALPSSLSASTDGVHWSARPVPCDAAAAEHLQVAPGSATAVALLCSANVQPGEFTKRVFSSGDTGRTTVLRGRAPVGGVPVGFAAVRPGVWRSPLRAAPTRSCAVRTAGTPGRRRGRAPRRVPSTSPSPDRPARWWWTRRCTTAAAACC